MMTSCVWQNRIAHALPVSLLALVYIGMRGIARSAGLRFAAPAQWVAPWPATGLIVQCLLGLLAWLAIYNVLTRHGLPRAVVVLALAVAMCNPVTMLSEAEFSTANLVFFLTACSILLFDRFLARRVPAAAILLLITLALVACCDPFESVWLVVVAVWVVYLANQVRQGWKKTSRRAFGRILFTAIACVVFLVGLTSGRHLRSRSADFMGRRLSPASLVPSFVVSQTKDAVTRDNARILAPVSTVYASIFQLQIKDSRQTAASQARGPLALEGKSVAWPSILLAVLCAGVLIWPNFLRSMARNNPHARTLLAFCTLHILCFSLVRIVLHEDAGLWLTYGPECVVVAFVVAKAVEAVRMRKRSIAPQGEPFSRGVIRS
jgi:hypothetical protein